MKLLREYTEIINTSPLVVGVLGRLQEVMGELGVTEYLLAGGAVYQMVWNHLLDRDLHFGLGDLDVVFFAGDTSGDEDLAISERVRAALAFWEFPVEVVNQAKVHLWHGEYFGVESRALTSLEDAVGSWMTTCSCVGVRKEGDKLVVVAPHGLEDIFNMVVRPNNKVGKSREIYNQKVEKWLALWPELRVVGW